MRVNDLGINEGKSFAPMSRRNEKPVEKLARCDPSILVDDHRSNVRTVITPRLPAQSQRVLRKPNNLFSKMIHQIGET